MTSGKLSFFTISYGNARLCCSRWVYGDPKVDSHGLLESYVVVFPVQHRDPSKYQTINAYPITCEVLDFLDTFSLRNVEYRKNAHLCISWQYQKEMCCSYSYTPASEVPLCLRKRDQMLCRIKNIQNAKKRAVPKGWSSGIIRRRSVQQDLKNI